MTQIPDNNRFAPPKVDLTEVANPDGGPILAGRGQRLVAVILDGILTMLIVYGAFFAFGGLGMFMQFNTNTAPDPFAMMAGMFRVMIPGYIIIAAIQGWSLHAFGGTLGKKLMGLRVVRTDGSRAGFVRLFFGRGAAAVLPNFIPLLNLVWWLLDTLLIFRDSRQCLHDQMADTIVVSAASSMNASLEASKAR